MQNTLNDNFENFIEQVSLYEKTNQADMGLSCGLIDEVFWSNAYRLYYVDCSRGYNGDLNEPRNVNIRFRNNTNVSIDIMIFIEYFTEMIVDVEKVLITK